LAYVISSSFEKEHISSFFIYRPTHPFHKAPVSEDKYSSPLNPVLKEKKNKNKNKKEIKKRRFFVSSIYPISPRHAHTRTHAPKFPARIHRHRYYSTYTNYYHTYTIRPEISNCNNNSKSRIWGNKIYRSLSIAINNKR
jgi:hypothetical protein